MLVSKKSFGRGRIGEQLYNDFWNIPDKIQQVIRELEATNSIERSPHSGKLRPRPSCGVQTPWFLIKDPPAHHCTLWFNVVFNRLGVFPLGCMNCWKVVVVPHADPQWQRVHDLFRMRDFLIWHQLPSKCGVDVRTITPHRYIGFIYSDSLGVGQNVYNTLKDPFLEEFPGGKIILKRGCTEMERRFGPSDKWQPTRDIMEWDKIVNSLFEPPPSIPQPEHMVADVFRFWIRYAYGIGDPSWREAFRYCGYEPPEDLYTPPVTYHEMEEENGNRTGEQSGATPMEDRS